MKVSEAKSRIHVGMVLTAIGHYNPAASGPRTVTKVQTTGFFWTPADASRKWTKWPPASRCRDDGPDVITLLMEDGRPMTTLTFPVASSQLRCLDNGPANPITGGRPWCRLPRGHAGTHEAPGGTVWNERVVAFAGNS